jgi:sugar phosphate isomerase/epimerase
MEIYMNTSHNSFFILLIATVLVVTAVSTAKRSMLGSDENLLAWAFLNYEPEGRSPDERAQMLKRLGFTRCGYEGHPRYIGQLEEHIIAYRKHGVELVGIYLEIRQANPLEQDYLKEAIEILERRKCKLQLWLTIKDSLLKDIPEDKRAEKACEYIRPLADKVLPMGCKIAMYNHGGWTGHPNNQVQVIRRLQTMYNPKDLGIVLNFHHAHPFIDEFPKLLKQVIPYLFVVNTNGMRVMTKPDGKRVGDPKILALGKGDHEVDMLRVVKESGYTGPIGVIDHMGHVDPEVNLKNNLKALKAILKRLHAEDQ